MPIVNVLKETKPPKQSKPKEPKKTIKTEKKPVDQETSSPVADTGAVSAKDYLRASEEILKETERLAAQKKPIVIDGADITEFLRVHPDCLPSSIVFKRARLIRSNYETKI